MYEKRLEKFLLILNNDIIDLPKLRSLSWTGIPERISQLSRKK